MANPGRGVLPKLLVASIVVVIVGWLTLLVMATPEPPPAEVVDRLSAEAVADVALSQTLAPRVETRGGTGAWLVGRGVVVAGFADKGPLSWDDLGGTLRFRVPSARVLSVSAEPLYLEGDDGARLPLPEDTSALVNELEVALRHDAVVGGILRQADELLIRHLRSRFNPMGYRVETKPAPSP